MSRPQTPLEAIYSSEEKGLMAEVEAEVHVLHAEDHFDEYLLKRWIDVFGMEGVFRNKLATLKTRKLEGRLGVTLQTDPGQVQGKRQNPAHKAVYIPVYQEFNPAAFNFAKAKPVETLFRLDFPPKPRGDHDGEAKSDAGPPPHAVLANISPLMICHSLLCLYIDEGLPQVLSPDMLVLGLEFSGMSRRKDLRLGFNSLGAWSSVNHLHFQVLTLNDLFTKPAFPVESAPRTFLWDCQPPPADDDEEADGADTGAGGGAGAGAPSADDNTVVSVFETAGWPIRAFVMKCRDGVNRQALADVAGTLVCVLLELDIPHNVLIGEAGAELYVFPRQPQAPCGNGAFNAAFCEVSGLAILLHHHAFDVATEADYVAAMEEASLSADEFARLKTKFLETIGGFTELPPSTPAHEASPQGGKEGEGEGGCDEHEEEKKGGSE